jgi:signal transduction histidine kinase
MGTFALYSREPGSPTPEQLNLIEQMTHLAAVAIERERAAEALRASEKLARGQVEALKRALDALATESDPDRLLGHILCTITEQFGAHSTGIWRRDETSGMIGFESAFEEGKLVPKTDASFAGMDLRLPMEEFQPWTEVFRTGKASVIEDIRTAKTFPLRDRLTPLGIITVLLVPMFVTGRLEGAIGIRFTQKRAFRAEEIELAQALASQAMLAMQLSSLHAQNRQTAVMEERTRMARDIHDTLAQGFTGVIMQLEATKGAIAQNNLAEATDRVERAGDLARVGLGEARRSVMALRPRSLQDTTLCLALDDLLKRMTNGSGLQAEFHLEGNEPVMPADWEEGLLRIAQESLTNTIKHGKAKAFRATLTIAPNEIQFRLVDDGVGFDLHAEHEGFGLVGMKERVDQIGGQFILRSMPGQGTEIQIILKNPTVHKADEGGEHA